MCCRVYLWVWWKRCRYYVNWITCDLMDTKNKTLPSREADLNHRPKDHWLNIRLQSSALPAELSRVGWWTICGWLWYDMWSIQRSELKAKIAFDTLKRILWWKKFPSREADLNHRPKDLWLNIQLQSSALPAELSRVDRSSLFKACVNVRADYFFNYNFVIIPLVTTQSIQSVGNFFFKTPGRVVVQVGFELATSEPIIRRHNHYTTRSNCKDRQNIRSYVIEKCRNLANLLSM